MSKHDPDHDPLPESILEMGKSYREPPVPSRDQIWQAVRSNLDASGLITDSPPKRSTGPVRRSNGRWRLWGDITAGLASGLGTLVDQPRDLVRRRVPHVVVGYAALSLGFLEFTDFIVSSFLISPHWNRVALTLVLLLIPSVLLLAYHHGLARRGQLSIVEKIGIPANLALAAGVLVALFVGVDLSAVTTSISVEDEEGNVVERVAVKQEFRKRVSWFFFDTSEGLPDEDSWVSYLVPDAILLDLAADDFFEPVNPDFESLRSAGYRELRNVPLSLQVQMARDLKTGHFFVGDVARSGDGFLISTRLHDSETGSLVIDRSYEGEDVLDLVDRITIDLKRDLEIPARDDIEDLPVSERLSTDRAALKGYARGYLEAHLVASDFDVAIEELSRAVDADPTFALAQFVLASSFQLSNRLDEAQEPMRAAMDNLYRIPERFQFVVKAEYYLFAQDYGRAEAVVRVWAALYPEDRIALDRLRGIQEFRGDLPGTLATLQALYRLSPEDRSLLQRIARIYRLMARYDASRVALEEYIEKFPEDYTGFLSLATLSQVQGELTPARQFVERALLMEPTRLSIVRRLAQLDLLSGAFDEAKAGLDRMLSESTTPREKFTSWSALQTYYEYRGEMDAAIDAIEHLSEEAGAFQAPITMLVSPLSDVETYLVAGRAEEAIDLVEERRTQLQPPMDLRVHMADFEIAIYQRDRDAARLSLQRAEARVTALGADGASARNEFDEARGRLAELQGDWEAALEAYRSALASDLENPMLHEDIGRVLQQMGELFEAEEETREALRLRPSSPHAHLLLAHLLVGRGDTVEAVEHLEWAMLAWARADPDYKPAQEARGALEELGR